MKAKLLSISAALVLIVFVSGCGKKNDGPKISLKLKSVNSTTINPGETLAFVFEFTPKSTNADTLFIARKFYTCSFVANDTAHFDFPEFDNNTKGELTYSFQYGSGGFFNGCINNSSGITKTDSLNYYFWVKDKSGNISDTIASPKIILKK